MYLEELENEDKEIYRGPNFYSVGGDTDFPCSNYMCRKYLGVPQRMGFWQNNKIRKSFWSWFLVNYPEAKTIRDGYYHDKKKLWYGSKVIEIESLKLLICLYQDKESKPYGESNFNMSVYYMDSELYMPFYNAMQEANLFYTQPVGREDNICLIVQKGDRIDTQEYPIKIKEMDVALNYGDDFIPVYNKIVKRLNNKDDKGIVLFHGVAGTGKTSLIKYLIKKVNKEVIFIPPSMAESITSPSFIPFLMDHPNSILVLEDAERVLQDRAATGNHNQGVSNILNVSDGILGDCLSIQVIATFNTDLKNIDNALLRKGRLIAEHEFKPLEVDRANRLLESLGKKHRVTKATILTDIYNIEEEEFKTIKGRQAVGFNAR